MPSFAECVSAKEKRRMSKFDWRSADTYTELLDVDAAAFAWEYLRRNPDYCRDYAALADIAGQEMLHSPAMRRKWGVCFRTGP